MSPLAADPDAAPCTLAAGLELVRTLRGDAVHGCGQARTATGDTVFVRWERREPISQSVGEEAWTTPEREYRVLASLPSAGVPEPLDLRRSRTSVTSVTSWVDGRTLGAAHREFLADIGAQLAATLVRAHWAGWVHGDLKPANIVVSDDGVAQIVDWAGARRIGADAPPGTLGYAPPWAWSASHEAQPCNDWYALAVTLWEIWSGRAAFDGDRAEVLEAQPAFDFPLAGDAPELLRTLTEAARRGAAPAPESCGSVATLARGARASILARQVVRPEALAAVRSAARAQRKSGEVFAASATGSRAEDAEVLADAVVDAARLETQVSAIRWGDLLDAATRRAAVSEAESGTSRADQLRNRKARIEAEAIGILAAREPALVVATAGELVTATHAIWEGLTRAANDTASSVRPAAFIVVSPAAGREEQTSGGVDRTRAVAEGYLCASSISERLIAFVSRRAAGSVTGAIEELRALSTGGGIAQSAAGVDLSDAAAAATTEQGTRELALATARRDAGPAATCTLDEALAWGEEAAADGRLSDVVRACIRAQSSVTNDGGATMDDVVRLADLWVECGRSDAAEAVLRTVDEADMSVECSLRLARVVMNRGDADGAERILAIAQQCATAHWQVAETGRLRAVVCLTRRDFDGAHALLRPLLRCRRELPMLTQLWLATTLGNVSRMRGRYESACRVLRWVKERAARSGSVRLQIAASTNLIVARSLEAAPSLTAAEAWSIAQRCFQWGMTTEGVVNTTLAATLWVGHGESSKARASIEDVLNSEALFHLRGSPLLQELMRLRSAAMDVSENWTELSLECVAHEPPSVGSADWLEVTLRRVELGEHLDALSVCRDLGCEVSREARCVAVALRLVARDAAPHRRLAIVLRQLGLAIDGALPTTSHAARAIARAASTRDGGAAFLHAARVIALEREPLRGLALAGHASALAWWESVDADSVRWFTENASADERRRPAGVRLWEWRLALARATAESGSGVLGASELEGVLAALEATMERVPLETRSTYNGIVPIELIARLAGLDGRSGRYDERVTKDPIRFNQLRAGLYRNWLVHGGTGGRAAGLERVLASALRLRSAVDVETLLGEIALGVIAICRAERAVVVYDAGRNEVRAKVATERGVASMAPSDTEVSLGAVAKVRETGHACLFDDACGDDDLGDRPSVMRFRPRSLIIAPLQTLGEHLGYVYVENRSVAKSFSDSDVQMVEGFAAQAALALENAQLVTELRRSCEELERARKDAIRGESLRVLGRMASEVAHDFNNLLTAIIGETQLLIHDAATPAVAQQLSVIERAALDGAEVIRRIQDSTRVRDDKTFDVVSVAEVLDNVLDMIRWRASAGEVRVATQIPPDLYVRGVASELREVFTNVVLNALDAMPGGGDLRIEATVTDGFVAIAIMDTGSGMTAETLAKVFDPFFTTKGDRGNGLGLSIAYGIMQRHGGEIRAESVAGRGTRMVVSLPISSPAERALALGSRRDDSAVPSVSRENLRVLVVDDEPTVARILASMLKRIGAEPEVSIGGNAALSRIASGQERFDVVITDVNMPDKNGIEVARELLNEERGPRVIVMSGSLGGREEDTARMLGVSVLRKPFTISDVNRVLFSAS